MFCYALLLPDGVAGFRLPAVLPRTSFAEVLRRKRQHLAAVRLRLDHVLIKQTVRDATETGRIPT
jgi:hypothetical protein